MKEYWINVYLSWGGRQWLGSHAPHKEVSLMLARQAIANGSRFLYRIHVRLK